MSLLWFIFGVAVGVGVMYLMHTARDPITREQAGVKLDKDEINGEEY